jgi:hypothetical protein
LSRPLKIFLYRKRLSKADIIVHSTYSLTDIPWDVMASRSMVLLEFKKGDSCLASGMAMPPPAIRFGTGFALARATRLLVTANMVIVTNRIVEEWEGLVVKRTPTYL